MNGTNKLSAQNPWPGLQAYSEEDRQFFFGRDLEIDQLLWLVQRNVLTIVFGPSGTGKTSLVQAGLFPKLRSGGLEPHWIRLKHGVSLIGQVQAEVGLSSETLWEGFYRLPKSPEHVVVFDQFEEIFTLGDARPETHAFLMQLADLVEDYYPNSIRERLEQGETLDFEPGHQRFRILLVLREDFVWCLDGLRTRMPSVMHARFLVAPFTENQALEAVEKPGREVVDAEAARQIVRVAASKRGPLLVDPAILCLLCRELNRARSPGSMISPGQLEGDSESILSQFWQGSIAALEAPDRQPVQEFIEDRLVSPSGFRTAAPREEVASHSTAIDVLIDGRLLRGELRFGSPHLELTHDVLCPVVQKTREERRQRSEQALVQIARERSEKEARFELVQAQARRTRIAAVVFSVLMLIALGAAGWAVRSRREAEKSRIEAETERVAADSERHKFQIAAENMRRSLLIRQAALSGNQRELDRLLSSLNQDVNIRFAGAADDLHYQDSHGREVYNFSVFPEAGTLPTGENAIAFITYLMEHSTFRNTLLTAGPDRGFRASYLGWGCLTQSVALVEYKDPTKLPTVTKFNMCESVRFQ
jgi:hypothetical protein